MLTESQEKRLLRQFFDMSGETVQVSQIKGTLYVYGSELACLRIFAVYNGKGNGALANKNTRVKYSENLKTWFFSLDLPRSANCEERPVA